MLITIGTIQSNDLPDSSDLPAPSHQTYEPVKCWCGAFASFVNEGTDATPEHFACEDHLKDGFRGLFDKPLHAVASVYVDGRVVSSCVGRYSAGIEAWAHFYRNNRQRLVTVVLYPNSRAAIAADLLACGLDH